MVPIAGGGDWLRLTRASTAVGKGCRVFGNRRKDFVPPREASAQWALKDNWHRIVLGQGIFYRPMVQVAGLSIGQGDTARQKRERDKAETSDGRRIAPEK